MHIESSTPVQIWRRVHKSNLSLVWTQHDDLHVSVYDRLLRTTRSTVCPFCWSIHKDHARWVWCLLQPRQSLCCTSTNKCLSEETEWCKGVTTTHSLNKSRLLMLTYLIKDFIDVGCCLCRSFQKEKTILLRISLSILQNKVPSSYNFNAVIWRPKY